MYKLKIYNKLKEVVALSLVDKSIFNKFNKMKLWLDNKGYVIGFYNGKHIKFHQIVIGKKLGFEIDHINRNKLDNRKINLRHTTHSKNIRNAKIQSNNISGLVGIHWGKHINKWIAEITLNRKIIYLGSFLNKDEATTARKLGEIKYFGCIRRP